jgi:(S)-ureidoglycine aminohydrolase
LDVFGNTRSSIQSNHALITPDTHVRSPLVGWTNADAVVHISPVLGARFTQYTAYMSARSRSDKAPASVQRFVYVLDGSIQLQGSKGEDFGALAQGHYAYIPAGSEIQLVADAPATLEVFEKRYVALANFEPPPLTVGDSREVASEAFMGDPDAQLRILLPKHPSFDMAVNLFTFQPGATLPLVEVHVMEHGLLLLEGAGVYRLGDRYYPITAGDVIWMGSYCPQWWVAMGKRPSTYLYYKDVYRELAEVSA